jgi:hypothetical protein
MRTQGLQVCMIRRGRWSSFDLPYCGSYFTSAHLQGDDDLVIVHDALGFGGCHLAVAVGRLNSPSLHW